MDAELRAKWVKALRSGYYRQARHTLYNGRKHAYCCIGVCAVISGWTPSEGASTGSMVDRLGIKESLGSELVNMNDRDGKSFPEIADYIEALS